MYVYKLKSTILLIYENSRLKNESARHNLGGQNIAKWHFLHFPNCVFSHLHHTALLKLHLSFSLTHRSSFTLLSLLF